MTKDDVREVVFEALRNINLERSPDDQVALSDETRLFGTDAVLDSLALVSVIVDVETLLADRFGANISLTDDRALSQAISPFSSVKALVEYAASLGTGSAA